MPDSDELFFAGSESSWRNLLNKRRHEDDRSTKLHPPSLATLYYLFQRHDFLHMELNITPLQLRLLLCTIQTQVIDHSMNNRFSAVEDQFGSPPRFHAEKNSAFLRQEELENMLTKWHVLKRRVVGSAWQTQAGIACMLVYHLIWLELYICHDDVQSIAGKDGHTAAKPLLPQLQRWAHSSSARKAIARVGQIFKLLQSSGGNGSNAVLRPVWWPLAVSRVALLVWCYGVGLRLSTGSTAGVDEAMLARSPTIILNDPEEDLDAHGKVIHEGEGIPCILAADGKLMPLHCISDFFDMCLKILKDGKSKSSPLHESVHVFLADMKRCGIPYSKV